MAFMPANLCLQRFGGIGPSEEKMASYEDPLCGSGASPRCFPILYYLRKSLLFTQKTPSCQGEGWAVQVSQGRRVR